MARPSRSLNCTHGAADALDQAVAAAAAWRSRQWPACRRRYGFASEGSLTVITRNKRIDLRPLAEGPRRS